MIPFLNAMSIAAGGDSGKTRAQFDAHVATLGTASTPAGGADGARYLDYADTASNGYGTPWVPLNPNGFAGFLSKIVGHCFPDEDTRLKQVGRRVFLQCIETGTTSTLSGLTRNGVSTLGFSRTGTYTAGTFLYYNDDLGQAFRMAPGEFSNNGPHLYDWTP